jgi:hypothetical protein
MQNFKKTRSSPIRDDSIIMREKGNQFLESFTEGLSHLNRYDTNDNAIHGVLLNNDSGILKEPNNSAYKKISSK